MTVAVQWLPRLERPQHLKIGGLFYGYGGLDMAVQEVIPNADLAWYAEFDKGASKIGAHHHPEISNHGDVTKVDWAAVEPVDILTGGSPCQDLSHAGKRAGMTEGTRSNLWVAMREAIAVIRPQLVVWENVRGAYSACADSEMGRCPRCVDPGAPGGHDPRLRALGRVVGDLADLGYDARWIGLRAADVGAPHGRFRVFLVASPADAGRIAREVSARGRLAAVEEPAGNGDSRGVGLTLLPTPAVNDMGEGKTVEWWDDWTEAQKAKHGNGNGHGASLAIEAQRLLPTPRASDGTKGGPNQAGSSGDLMLPSAVQPSRWGAYSAAIARWEQALRRLAPEPTELSAKGTPRLSPRLVEWMMGLPAGHVTDIPGITRNEALKALGNGVVPQQAVAALRVLLGDS